MNWQEFIDWIGDYNNLIPSVQVFVASVTAFATIVLVYVTWVLARVSKPKPYVVCITEPMLSDFAKLNVVIRNTGTATAFDIKVEISPAVPRTDEKFLEDKTTNFPVSVLPPGKGYPHRSFFWRSTSIKEFSVSISWASKPNQWRWKRKSLKYTIDNSDKRKTEWKDGGIHEIHQELKGIREHFERFNPRR